MKTAIICIALMMLCSSVSGQKWSEFYDKFTKKTTWKTETYRIPIVKAGGFLSDDYLNIYLSKGDTWVVATIGFGTSLNYESIATEETKVTLLYSNDSTTTVSPLYAKSSLMQLLGKAWYHTSVSIDVPPLQTPLKALRVKLNEYNKDFTLKDDAVTSLLYFINKAVDSMPTTPSKG